MANSDYTVRPERHGFCPVGYLTADIEPLDTAVTMTGFTSPTEDGIRIGMAAMITSIIPSDPYADDVILLVQGGENGSLVVQDRSSFGDSVTITNYAAFDSEHPVFDANPIKVTTVIPGVPAFISTGSGSRFARSVGDKFTIECYVYWETMANFAPSVPLWKWNSPTGRIQELRFEGNTGNLYLRNGDDSAILLGNVPANTLAFTQLNLDGNAYTVDLNGTQVGAGTNNYGVGLSGTYSFFVASYGGESSTGTGTEAWVTPLRMTKGVLRARGSVPTGPFQSSSTAFSQEIVQVTARTGNNLTLARGCCDTVPAAHSTGDAIWFFDDSIGSDKLEYAGTETIGVKVLPRTTTTVLPIEHAPPIEVEFNLRFARPYPPGLVEVNGDPWFTTPITLSSAAPTLAITWAHRDRITQQDQLVDHLEASIGPEAGTTYEIRVYRADSTLLRTVTGLTGTSWNYPVAEAVADFSAAGSAYPGYITLRSMRDGLASFQDYRIDFTLDSAGVTITEEMLTLTVSLPVQPSGGSLSMAYVQAPAAASPGAAMVRFFTPSLLLAEPVPAGQTFVINFGQRANNAGPTYYLVQYQTTAPTTRETIVTSLKEQIDYLLLNSTSPALSDYIELATVSDYGGNKWLHLIGQFGVEFMAEGTGLPDPPGVSRPTVTGSNTSMISWANGAAVVPVALSQIVTATVTGTPAAGDRFTVTLNGTSFSHTALSGATVSSVATALAALIDADANYSASAVGAVITIDGLTPTNVFTYSGTSESLFAF